MSWYQQVGESENICVLPDNQSEEKVKLLWWFWPVSISVLGSHTQWLAIKTQEPLEIQGKENTENSYRKSDTVYFEGKVYFYQL